MLGTKADAEDAVQDAWLRWHETQRTELQSEDAWLVRIISVAAQGRKKAIAGSPNQSCDGYQLNLYSEYKNEVIIE